MAQKMQKTINLVFYLSGFKLKKTTFPIEWPFIPIHQF